MTDWWQWLFESTLPIDIGFKPRYIALISYALWFSIAYYFLNKHKEIPFCKRFIAGLFFVIFTSMVGDFGWTIAQNLRWRSYIPQTGEMAWISFQPTPFGSNMWLSPLHWLLEAYAIGMSIVALYPLFKQKIMTINKWVITSYAIYQGFWITLMFIEPNPLFGDNGLWVLWPELARQTGETAFHTMLILNDVVSRLFLMSVWSTSWWIGKKLC